MAIAKGKIEAGVGLAGVGVSIVTGAAIALTPHPWLWVALGIGVLMTAIGLAAAAWRFVKGERSGREKEEPSREERGGAFAGRDNTGTQQIFHGPVTFHVPPPSEPPESVYTQIARDRRKRDERLRHPDAIWQLDENVGSVQGTHVHRDQGIIIFDVVNTDGRFNFKEKFEYREYVLIYAENPTGGEIGSVVEFGPIKQITIQNMYTKIIGRREGADG